MCTSSHVISTSFVWATERPDGEALLGPQRNTPSPPCTRQEKRALNTGQHTPNKEPALRLTGMTQTPRGHSTQSCVTCVYPVRTSQGCTPAACTPPLRPRCRSSRRTRCPTARRGTPRRDPRSESPRRRAGSLPPGGDTARVTTRGRVRRAQGPTRVECRFSGWGGGVEQGWTCQVGPGPHISCHGLGHACAYRVMNRSRGY